MPTKANLAALRAWIAAVAEPWGKMAPALAIAFCFPPVIKYMRFGLMIAKRKVLRLDTGKPLKKKKRRNEILSVRPRTFFVLSIFLLLCRQYFGIATSSLLRVRWPATALQQGGPPPKVA